MKNPIMTALALGLASLALVQMSVPADARSRHKSGKVTRSGSTGGKKASPSAVGGNANQPSKPGAQGSGGGSQ